MSTHTKEELFTKAVAEIEALGIKWYMGEGACCYGCTNLPEMLSVDLSVDTYLAEILVTQHGSDPSWSWNMFGSHLTLTVWEDELDFDYEEDEYVEESVQNTYPVTELSLFHGGDLERVAAAVAVFEANGFETRWNGTDADRVTVLL
ncbi:hypothetical protein [Microbacterium sp. p3-SID336]|uniref:hypothetical protein n=1 Tax=Microbacterium sp. p3-SID336 TaxID=2916212 RepID=UPI0021A84585|nr:hypothetical protein [Microbacterium sp. p3-SID336]MCT1478698.1 hypothetical protein [Microbacterium sp. p3-SID336]